MKVAIIYHDADYDGKLSNEVCRYFLTSHFPKAAVHSYGWDYGRPVPVPSQLLNVLPYVPDDPSLLRWDHYDAIYIVDLSVDGLMAKPELQSRIVWIDHHKSAIKQWDESDDLPEFLGYRIDGVAACRLCYQWFRGAQRSFQDPRYPNGSGLPALVDYLNRMVDEPKLIRLAGEYDIWDHRDPNAKALQFGLRSISDECFGALVHYQLACGPAEWVDEKYLTPVIEAGRAIKAYCDKQADEYSAAFAQTIHWEGLTFCVLNIGQRGNGDLLRGGIKPEHQACFAWRHVGAGANPVYVSLYHAPGHEDLDLSEIAKRWGGGGHRGACGFRTTLTQLDLILSGAAT